MKIFSILFALIGVFMATTGGALMFDNMWIDPMIGYFMSTWMILLGINAAVAGFFMFAKTL
jgi:general stress protein CsbA